MRDCVGRADLKSMGVILGHNQEPCAKIIPRAPKNLGAALSFNAMGVTIVALLLVRRALKWRYPI